MFEELFHAGVAILSTTRDKVTNTILAQLGSIVDEYVYTDKAEWYQHVGFASRPSNPKKGEKAAEGVGIKTGNRDIIVASRDIRGQQLYANLKEGETCIYAAGSDGNGQARILLKADGSVTLFTRENNQPGAIGAMVFLGADNTAGIQTKNGGIRIDEKGILLTAGKSSLYLNADGSVQLNGNGLVTVAGKATVIGNGATASPASAALHGPTGAGGIASSNVFIGT